MPDRPPLVAVSTGFGDDGDYLGLALARPLAAAGAVPVIAPYVEDAGAARDLLARVDGLVLGFGADIDPARYGAPPSRLCGPASAHRDASELLLAREALAAGVPVLGVCRGMQILNVVLEGTLRADHSLADGAAARHPGGDWDRWRDVVAATLAGRDGPAHPSHPIAVAPGSALAAVLGREAVVNSYHHQALERLGEGVVAVAHAPDGVVEAIEVPDAPALCVAVQWELQESWRTDAAALGVFGLLVDAATAGRPAAARAS